MSLTISLATPNNKALNMGKLTINNAKEIGTQKIILPDTRRNRELLYDKIIDSYIIIAYTIKMFVKNTQKLNGSKKGVYNLHDQRSNKKPRGNYKVLTRLQKLLFDKINKLFMVEYSQRQSV